jgi:tetratricopeptide (TPR) repeat protein
MNRKVLFVLSIILVPFFAQAQNEPKWKKWEVLADSAFAQENFKSAVNNYSKAIKGSKLQTRDDYSLFYKRAVSYLNFGRPDQALEDISIFIEQFPMAYQAYLLKAYLQLNMDLSNDALSTLDQALELNPLNPDVMKWKAEILLNTGDANEVKQVLLALPKQFRDPQTEVMLGMAYYQLDKNDSALYFLNQSLRMDPFFYPALMYAAIIHLEESNYDLALDFIDKALLIDNSDPTLYFYKGAILAEQDKLDEACRFLNRAFYRGVDDAADYLKQYCFNEGR